MKKTILLYILLLFPVGAAAQAMTVIGGEGKARECYRNASISSELEFISNSMIEPCEYALEYSNLNISNKAATFANRGILLVAQNKLEKALNSYENALAILPEQGEIYLNRGNAWFFNKDYSMALDDYEKARELGIQNIHFTYFNIGLTQEKLGNYSQAEKEYRRALNIEPDWHIAIGRLNLLLEKMTEQNNTN